MSNQSTSSFEELLEEQLVAYYGEKWPEVKAQREAERLAIEQRSREYNGEWGLARLERTLGLSASGDESVRVDTIVTTINCRVAEWEQMTPSALIQHDDAISALFSITDKVSMSAYMNQGRLPACWWASLAIRLNDAGLYDRLNDQIFRETQARSAQKILRDERSMGGKRRAAKDPKAVAKASALELWKERHAGKHPKLRTNEQFATEVMRRWPVLTSSAVICGWCTSWNKEAKAKKKNPVS